MIYAVLRRTETVFSISKHENQTIPANCCFYSQSQITDKMTINNETPNQDREWYSEQHATNPKNGTEKNSPFYNFRLLFLDRKIIGVVQSYVLCYRVWCLYLRHKKVWQLYTFIPFCFRVPIAVPRSVTYVSHTHLRLPLTQQNRRPQKTEIRYQMQPWANVDGGWKE